MIRESLSTLIRSPDLEKISLMLAKPNIFEILKLSNYEIRHSNFLAWLLDPKQSHNLGDTLLKWFLKEVFQHEKVSWINEFEVDGVNTHDVAVHREYEHIDLLIEFSHWIVVIENKFGTSEHSNQLERYRKVADKHFPDKRKAFVYLTPYPEEPKKQSDSAVYVNFTYEHIVRLLEQARDIYSDTLPDAVLNYIGDYIRVLKRHVMQDDEAIKLAQKIYENHREALDFIFQYKPDRLLEIDKVFAERVKRRGYLLGSTSKGHTRFLPPNIFSIIPRESERGWPNKELFLYEFGYSKKRVYFRAVVAPGDQAIRQRLIDILSKVDGARKTSSPSWSSVHSVSFSYNLTGEKFQDSDELVRVIDKMLDDIHDIVVKTSECIEYHW